MAGTRTTRCFTLSWRSLLQGRHFLPHNKNKTNLKYCHVSAASQCPPHPSAAPCVARTPDVMEASLVPHCAAPGRAAGAQQPRSIPSFSQSNLEDWDMGTPARRPIAPQMWEALAAPVWAHARLTRSPKHHGQRSHRPSQHRRQKLFQGLQAQRV